MHLPVFHVYGSFNRKDSILQNENNLYGLKINYYNCSKLIKAKLLQLKFQIEYSESIHKI